MTPEQADRYALAHEEERLLPRWDAYELVSGWRVLSGGVAFGPYATGADARVAAEGMAWATYARRIKWSSHPDTPVHVGYVQGVHELPEAHNVWWTVEPVWDFAFTYSAGGVR